MADPGADARKELDWDLHIHVPTQGVRKSVRVTSDESVGALMIKIAEKLGGSSTQLHKLTDRVCAVVLCTYDGRELKVLTESSQVFLNARRGACIQLCSPGGAAALGSGPARSSLERSTIEWRGP